MLENVLPRYEAAQKEASPLVLDLDGDGIELINLNSPSSVFWDGNQDGVLEESAWVHPDDGLLVLDLNHNGSIDHHSELFGTEVTDGFTVLATRDSNADGRIDISDPDFGALRVWRDANGDARTDAGELSTLAELGIASISLVAIPDGTIIAGNRISHASEYVLLDGTTRVIADAWFRFDNIVTDHNIGPEGYRLAAFTLPTIRGYGNVPSLPIALSADDELLEAARQITTQSVADLFDPSYDLPARFQDLLFRWGGVHTVDPASRGNRIDARELALLEALTASEFRQRGDPNPANQAAATLHEGYLIVFNATLFRFLAQTAAAELISDLGIYDYAADEFTGTPAINLETLGELVQSWTYAGQELLTAWGNLLRFFDGGVSLSALSAGDRAALETLIAQSDPAGQLTYAIVFNSVFPANWVRLSGDDDANTLSGGAGGDIMRGLGGNDTLFGREGHDLLEGGDDNDALNGEGGDDTLLGGDGDDLYVYMTGVDTIRDSSGTDTIRFAEGLTIADITLLIAPYNEADAHIHVGGQLAIVVEDMFTTTGAMEAFQFGAAAPTSIADLIGPQFGNETDDTLTGRDSPSVPQDTLRGFKGNDRLIGGLGDDRLFGGPGNDTYVVTAGTDVIEDSEGFGDRIEFGPGYVLADLQLARSGNDLAIAFAGATAVLVRNQFAPGGAVEQLLFQDGMSYDLLAHRYTLVGTTGRDTVRGIDSGAGGDILRGLDSDDLIEALGGDDELDGGDGDDTLYGGLGDDRYLRSGGLDTVRETGGLDTLVLGDLDPARVGMVAVGADLMISVDGVDVFRVVRQFTEDGQVERLGLGSGGSIDLLTTVLPLTGSSASETMEGRGYGASPNDVIRGLDGSDRLNGRAGDDLLDGGPGDDELYGGSGDDRYEPGSGRNLILDDGEVDDLDDAVHLPSGVLPANVTLTRDSNGALLIAWLGGTVAIERAYVSSYAVEHLVFETGERWNLLERLAPTIGTNASETLTGNRALLGPHVDHLIGLLGNDRLEGEDGDDTLDGGGGNDFLLGDNGADRYLVGEGHDVIRDAGLVTDAPDRVELPEGITPAVVSLWRTNDGILVVEWPGGSVRIERAWEPAYAVEELAFVTGEVWQLPTRFAPTLGTDGAEVLRGNREALGSRDDTIRGFAGADILYGYDGADTLEGGTGNDTLYGDSGNDTYVVGHGWDYVQDDGDAADTDDTLRIGVADITIAALIFERLPNSDIRIGWNGGANGVTIYRGLTGRFAIEHLELADGTREALATQSFVDVTPPANQTFTGDNLPNTLIGGDGNDQLFGLGGDDVLDGGAGNDLLEGRTGKDTYLVGLGHDVVWDLGSAADGNDEVQLTLDIGASALSYTRLSDGELVIRWSGGSVQIGDAFDLDRAVERLVLKEGTTIDLTQVAFITEGTEGSDTLLGNREELGSRDDVIRGFGGDDALYGYDGADTLEGGAGSDQMEGGPGGDRYIVEGHDRIYDDGNAGDAADSIVLPAGIARADLTLTRDVGSSLRIAWPGGSATVENAFAAARHVERLVYGDGSFDLIAELPVVMMGTHGRDSIDGNTGIGSLDDEIHGLDGNDTLEGGAGRDRLVGGVGDDQLYGGAGADTYVVGEGADTILDNGATDDGNDIIVLPAGILPTDIVATRFTDGDLLLAWGTASVRIERALEPRFAVEELHFSNGSILSTVLLPFETRGSGEHETLYGSSAALGPRADAILGMDGNDYLYGEDGADLLNGGPGIDTMWGGPGDDTFIVDHPSDRVYEYAKQGTDTVESSVTFSLAGQEIEILKLTSGGASDGIGNEFDNRLVGNASANLLTSGAGKDQVEGGGGADQLNGGPDDDVIRVPDINFVLVDGGPGTDKLELTGGGVSLDLTAPGDPRVVRIERIDLTGTGVNQLVVSAAAVQALASGTNDLVVDGDLGDSVIFADAGWLKGNTADGRVSYSNAGATLGINTAVDAPPCFAAGTRVLTMRGEVAVEALREGDLVIVHSAVETRPVRWVGHRHIRLAGHPRPWDVHPVRIHAHAFGPSLPHRPLRLSPDHAVYWDGVLIPIRYLVNGATIVQETVKEITYYHIELAGSGGTAAHDVLFAHGLTAESYLDTGNRAAFANGGAVVTMHPDFGRDAWDGGCAPLVLDGPEVETVRVTLLAQATTLGHELSADPALHLVVDGAVVEAEREGSVYRFSLPPLARDVRLVSRTTVPAETRPDSSDTRRLGVAVTRLALDGVPLALGDARLGGGWHGSEGDWRWTAGNAALAIAGCQTLEVAVADLESYWIRTAAVARRTRMAAG
jgi:Ca2+-binding RTX toxin-like protein